MEKITKAQAEKLLNLSNIIAYLETTTEESWCVDVCRDKKGRNCLKGHLFEYGEKDGYASYVCDMFEEMYATDFMYYPVNDGKHEEYQQSTPKQRVIAYLKDLQSGKQKTTYQLMDEEASKYESINNKD